MDSFRFDEFLLSIEVKGNVKKAFLKNKVVSALKNRHFTSRHLKIQTDVWLKYILIINQLDFHTEKKELLLWLRKSCIIHLSSL